MRAKVLLLIALVIWAICFASSFALAKFVTPDTWFLPAFFDKLFLFLLWQTIAAFVAILVVIVGFFVDKSVKWRWLMWGPITIVAVELIVVSLGSGAIQVEQSTPPVSGPVTAPVTTPAD